MKKKYFCGPYYAPVWLIKALSLVFNPACEIHDKDYTLKKKPRLIIEFMFLLNMLEILFLIFIDLIKLALKFILGCVMCPTFFILVVFFGWISFHKKVKIPNNDDMD